ncbi:MAG TPA: DUF72 domain-containing protein [Sphingomicrobium sp.]
MFRIGTAGWSIPRQYAGRFPAEGTSLERFAGRFSAAEINSSFHRPHRPATWERWRDSVPANFRFSVKVPKEITHQRKLIDPAEPLERFIDQARLLGNKLAVLLVQLPPKLAFDAAVACEFFTALIARSSGRIACEPRHPSWFGPDADEMLARLNIARVAADPAPCPAAAVPDTWSGLAYFRLHGSPKMYRSPYGERVHDYADELKRALDSGREAWCIFDNTASSAAMGDALALMDELSS